MSDSIKNISEVNLISYRMPLFFARFFAAFSPLSLSLTVAFETSQMVFWFAGNYYKILHTNFSVNLVYFFPLFLHFMGVYSVGSGFFLHMMERTFRHGWLMMSSKSNRCNQFCYYKSRMKIYWPAIMGTLWLTALDIVVVQLLLYGQEMDNLDANDRIKMLHKDIYVTAYTINS